MQNSKTQKFIDRYCEHIDQLLKLWEDGADKNTTNKLAKRAEFFHLALGINEKFHRFSGALINPNINDLYYDLEDYKHDQSFTDNLIKQMALRKKHILGCKALALKTSSPITEIESGPYKGSANEEELEELLDSLKHMKKAMNCKAQINHIEGANANRLIVEMGFVSKWRSLAKRLWMTSKEIMPYQPKIDIFDCITTSGHAHITYTDSEKTRINQWIQKVNNKISSLSKESEEGTIPVQYRTAPTSKKRLVECWGGDMTMPKLRSMIKNKRIRCIEHTRQSYTFDKRDLPSNVSKALEQ